MYYHGGVYLDMDAECLRPIGNFVDGLSRGSTAIVGGYPEPFFMMSTVGNKFWLYAFEKIIDEWKNYNVRQTGGPQGLQRMLKQYVSEFGQDAIRPFTMANVEECKLIQPPGDVKVGEETYRWITSREDFPIKPFRVRDKVSFIPNQIVDPTACLYGIGNCRREHCHDREDLKGALFVHHCLESWGGEQAQ